MAKTNLERMIKLADEFFAMKNDPSQISMTPETMERLRNLHPNTLTEKRNKDGPIAWIALIPTTRNLMKQFLSGKINERELFDLTPQRGKYDALYLCSALVLPEHRGKGLAWRLACKAIASIRKQHPIKYLFLWAFSEEGKKLAASIAEEFDLPLYQRQ